MRSREKHFMNRKEYLLLRFLSEIECADLFLNYSMRNWHIEVRSCQYVSIIIFFFEQAD